MHGPEVEHTDPKTNQVLDRSSTASITTILRRQYDIKNLWCSVRPPFPGTKVIEDVLLKEDREEFIRMKLAQGASLDGLYPTSPETEKEFWTWRVKHKRG